MTGQQAEAARVARANEQSGALSALEVDGFPVDDASLLVISCCWTAEKVVVTSEFRNVEERVPFLDDFFLVGAEVGGSGRFSTPSQHANLVPSSAGQQ